MKNPIFSLLFLVPCAISGFISLNHTCLLYFFLVPVFLWHLYVQYVAVVSSFHSLDGESLFMLESTTNKWI